MFLDMLNEYVEDNRKRKALKGCLEILMDEGHINEESFSILYDYIDEHIPADE